MIYRCAICETRIYHRNRYFCWHCYKNFKEDISKKKEWTKFLMSEESKRRYKDKNPQILIYLGDKWDVDTDGNLIRKEGYRYGQEKKRARGSG